jgi:type IV pilus modification protein PilV
MKPLRSPRRRALAPRRQHGFSLIEALVSLLIVSFGMLGIAAFQFTLSRSSDVAKQRTEATRIAQREIDRLRSFAQRESDGNTADDRYTYVDDVVAWGPSPVTATTTNTTFNLQRVVGTDAGDRLRWINVVVTWADRAGQPHEVRLASAVSDGDPSAIGVLGVIRRTAWTLSPKNRNVNVPFPLVNLAGGQTSAFSPPSSNVVFTVDNVDGLVLQRCTGVTTLSEGIDLATAGATCTSYAVPGYLLSGYVRFKTQGLPASASNIDDPGSLTDPTLPLLPTVYDTFSGTFTSQPMTITSSATGHAAAGYECYSQRQLTVRGATAQPDLTINEGDPLPTGYTDIGAPRFIAYACVVVPIDHDSDATTAAIWSGTVTLSPDGWNFGSSGSLGPTSGTGRLCRLTSDYNGNNALSNSEHPRFYRQVSGALDSQNFLVVNGGDSCPTDVAADLSSGNLVDTNTARHQPSPQLSFRCLTIACTGGNRISMESNPSNPVAAIPME